MVSDAEQVVVSNNETGKCGYRYGVRQNAPGRVVVNPIGWHIYRIVFYVNGAGIYKKAVMLRGYRYSCMPTLATAGYWSITRFYTGSAQ